VSLDPLHQFEIHHYGQVDVMGYTVAVTNQSIWVMGISLGLCALMILGTRPRQMVPGPVQSALEMAFEFVENMITSTAGREGLKFFPFVFTLFTFIAACNLFGLVPGAYTSTSQITVTGSLALLVFAIVWIVGLTHHGIKFFTLFAPAGTPSWMLPVIVPLELISFFARPFTLAVRLTANMLAGHVLLKVFAGFAILLLGALGVEGGLLASTMPAAMLIAVTALELFVALLQAYIFTILTCVYLNDAIHLH